MNFSISPNNDGGEETGESKSKRLVSILEKFGALSPEIQEKILQFVDEIEQSINKEDGQRPDE